MAPISLDQLYQVIEKQDMRIAHLASELEKLKEWSDLNDHYLQDMIDTTCSSVDHLRTVINEMHDADKINHRIEELEVEDTLPVAQLLRTFIENNASDEQKEEMRNPK